MNTNTNAMPNEEIKKWILGQLGQVQRPGMDKLIAFLEKSDYFTAPASTRHSDAEPGGLARHSFNVLYRLQMLAFVEEDSFGTALPADSVIIVALFHDLRKVGFYSPEWKNKKTESGWKQEIGYTVADSYPYGSGGEKSVSMLEAFIPLTREERIAIRWVAGGFDYAVRGGDPSVHDAFRMYPLAVLLHTADLMATYMDGRRDEE